MAGNDIQGFTKQSDIKQAELKKKKKMLFQQTRTWEFQEKDIAHTQRERPEKP